MDSIDLVTPDAVRRAALWARRYHIRQCVTTQSGVGQRPVAASDMDAMDEVSEWAVANARELAALDAKARAAL